MKMQKAIVVGAGINGVVAAIELRKRGHEVALVDPGPLPHPLAASTDISKAVRAAYGGDEDYTALAEQSREIWRQWNMKFGVELYHEIGFLLCANARYSRAILNTKASRSSNNAGIGSSGSIPDNCASAIRPGTWNGNQMVFSIWKPDMPKADGSLPH